LAVFPELRQLKEGFFYHGSMVVRNNRFLAAERPLISMMSVAEAVVENNRFESDDSYEFNHKSRDGYFFTDRNSPKAAFLHCGKVVLQNNPGFDC